MRQQTITPSKKLSELQKTIEPYIELWDEWTSSGATFLSKRQTQVIENYLLSGSHLITAKVLGISPKTSASVLNKSIRRLKWNRHHFQRWLTERLLERHDLINYSSDIDRFLNSPYQFLPISSELKVRLTYFDEETLGEILARYSEESLVRWPLYPRIMKYLKSELYKMDCINLLVQNHAK